MGMLARNALAMWFHKRLGMASGLANVGMAVAVDGMTVIAFDPTLGGEVWRLNLEGRDTVASPALVSIIGSRVYIRSADELVCIGEGGAR